MSLIEKNIRDSKEKCTLGYILMSYDQKSLSERVERVTNVIF